MIIQEKINQYTGVLWLIENCIYYTVQDTFYSFKMPRNTDNLNLTTLLNKDQIKLNWKKKNNLSQQYYLRLSKLKYLKPSWLSIFTNIAHTFFFYDSVQILRALLKVQVWIISPLSHPSKSEPYSILMHIYFGCIILIRNLLQDTVGEIRLRKTAWNFTDLGLNLSCDTIKGNITDHVSQPLSSLTNSSDNWNTNHWNSSC